MSERDMLSDVTEEEKKVPDSENNETHKEKEEYEEVCYLCRRPESKAGKMVRLPGVPNVCICADCMQKTFEAMGQIGFPMGDMSGFDPSGMPIITNINMNGVPTSDGNGNGVAEPDESSNGTLNPNDTPNLNGSGAPNSNFMQGIPHISMINLGDFMGMMPQPQKIKKKKAKEEKDEKPVLDIKSIPAPHKIKASLDEYVVGQEHAKKVISVAVYNHYKRVAADNLDGIEIEKSNMLMIGPTGSGKTYLVKTLPRLLDVPLAIADATSLTEAGYIGDDIESVVSKLLAAADNDVERAEHGIIFIDEIDKIAKKKDTHQRDVSGESVQQGMLKLLEGAEIEVPVGANSKNAMVPLATVNTKDILFICGGAFPDLTDIIKERLNKHSSMGFRADLKDKYDEEENLISRVTVEDIRKYGMIPEFLGRLPIIFTLDALTEDMMVQILKEPKNAIIKQYQKLLALDEVQLEFEEDALRAIARKAREKDVGARALRAIIEDFMLDIMYEIPKDDNIGKVLITKAYIEKTGGPVITMRGYQALQG